MVAARRGWVVSGWVAAAGLTMLLSCCSRGFSQGAEKSTPTLRATSRIVYVDVVVHDGYGRIVHGLKQESFSLSENHQAQTISLFEEHVPTALLKPISSAKTQALENAQPEVISNVPKTPAGAALDMVLLDLVDTAPTDQVWARIQMVKFLRSVPPGHRVALFILSNRLHMVQGFTSDSAELAKAAESIKASPLGRVQTQSDRIIDSANKY